MKSPGVLSKRQFSKRASSVPSVTQDSESTQEVSMEEDLQRNIENNLAKIQRVAREYCLVSEEHILLSKQLKVLKKDLEDSKQDREDELDLKRAEMRGYNRKYNIAQTQVDNIGADIGILREEVDSLRKMKKFNKEADFNNRKRLRANIFENYKRGKSVSYYRNETTRNVHNFHEILNQAKIKKLKALEIVKKMKDSMPVLGTDRNLDMKYYKDMEEYEIISRKVLRKRIKRMLVKNNKNIDLVLTYINDLQAIDSAFTTIKLKESVDTIEDIMDVLKRYHDKSNEMFSKMSEVSNQVDNFQQKIELGTNYNLSIMEITSLMKVKYDDDEEEKIQKDQQLFNIKTDLQIKHDDTEKVVTDCKKLCIEQYKNWLVKSATQNVLIPLPPEEIPYEELEIRKYQGFMESLTKGIIKFKEEKEEREKEEEAKRQKELEMKKSRKSNKGKRQRSRQKRFAESSSKSINRSQSKSKASHSRSRANIKDMSKSSIRSRKNISNAKHIQKTPQLNKKSGSQVNNSMTMGNMETENTLPSIFDHRRFHKEMGNIAKQISISKEDRYKRNESIFDLRKLKRKHRDMFMRKNNSVDMNNYSLVDYKKIEKEEEDQLAHTSMIN